PLNVELDLRVHRANMPGVDEEPLAGGEIALDDLARQVEEGGAGPAHPLQDEPFAAEETGADALLPGDLQGHRFFGAHERLLAADHRLAGGELHRHDRAGKARREGDMAVAARG